MTPNEIAALVFAVLFAVASFLNIYFGFKENERPRKISKPFCLAFLSIALICLVPNAPLIYIGAFFGLLGDIVLIWKDDKRCVAAGVLSFMIGHLCYISQAFLLAERNGAIEANPLSWLWVLIYCLGIYALCFYPIYRLTKGDRVFTFGGTAYAAIVITDSVVAILGCALGEGDWLSLMLVGGIFFAISDSILSYTIFQKDLPKRDFYIMLTYLLGQAFIVSGLAFTFLK